MSDSENALTESDISFAELLKLIEFRVKSGGYSSKGRKTFPAMESTDIESDSRVLVVAPHQDDEILGCGGTLSKYALRGASIKVVYLTDGRHGGPDYSGGDELVEIRKIEAQRGLRTLGCSDAVFLGHPDMGLTCSKEEVQGLRSIIFEFVPHKIFIPFFAETHPDHMVAGRIAAFALRKYPADIECYNYEVWTPLTPNVTVDITDAIDTKLDALSKHESQIAIIDYVEKIKGLNAYRSITAGKQVKYCEAFFKCSREQYTQMAEELGVFQMLQPQS